MKMLKFGYESSTAVLIIREDGRMTLSSVHSENRRNGDATVLLEMITEYADENGMDMDLVALPCGEDPPMNSLQLKGFYEWFGFVALDDEADYHIRMTRKARKLTRMIYTPYYETPTDWT